MFLNKFMVLTRKGSYRDTRIKFPAILSGEVNQRKEYVKRSEVTRALSPFREVNYDEKPILLMDGISIVGRHLDVLLTLSARFRR